MPDKEQTVDGFSDNTSQQKLPTHGEQAGVPASPDLGETHKGAEPLSPQEYARLKKEAEEENDQKS